MPSTPELVARIAERMLARADEMFAEFDQAVFEAAPALVADATLAAEASASNRANVLRWLDALRRHPDEPVPEDVPPEALDIARSLVRRGAGVEALIPAYRRGQRIAWARWMEAAAEEVADPQQLIAVLDVASAQMFDYVDRILERIFEQIEREREELRGGAGARRMEAVRLILDGAPIPQGRASAQLGYELARHHTALVLWADPPGRAQGALERAANALARAAGAHRPLTVPAGTAALWAWLGTDGRPAPLVAEMDEHVRVAAGPALPGITGFRRSHAAAIAAQRLVAANPQGEPLVRYEDVEVVTLVAADEERLRDFVAGTLGELAADPVLRETVRVYLEEGAHAPRAAQRLHTHRNTILHRIARAEELLGHPVGERRLAVALALETLHRLGPRALPSPGRT